MGDEEKQVIDEFRRLVMDLHRTAGRLDNIISSIENCYEEYSDDRKMVSDFVELKYRARITSKYDKGYDDLDTREEELWNRLIGLTKN